MTLLDEIKSGESQTIKIKQKPLNLFVYPFKVENFDLRRIPIFF